VTPPDLALHLSIIRLDHGHTCRTPLVDVLVPEPQVCIFLYCFSGTHRVTFQRERERDIILSRVPCNKNTYIAWSRYVRTGEVGTGLAHGPGGGWYAPNPIICLPFVVRGHAQPGKHLNCGPSSIESEKTENAHILTNAAGHISAPQIDRWVDLKRKPHVCILCLWQLTMTSDMLQKIMKPL
jgi:hypothetical protein